MDVLAPHLTESLNRVQALFCHAIEPRTELFGGYARIPHPLLPVSAFKGTLITAGGYNREEGDKVMADGCADPLY